MSHRWWSALVLALPLLAGCSPQPTPCKFVFPEGFEGGAAVLYGVASAPPLPKDGAMNVAEIPQDGILRTSSPLVTGNVSKDEFYWHKGSGLAAIPYAQQLNRTTGTNRTCNGVERLFIGEKAKYDVMQAALDAKLALVCESGGGAAKAAP